jgi:hypothetical protein
MDSLVIAEKGGAIFLAHTERKDYVVFSLNDAKRIDLGDTLSYERWDNPELFVTAQNLTKKHEVNICLEWWGVSRGMALNSLDKLGRHGTVTTYSG